jgi:DNA-binding TFAR19-related protein (PDSD5 family)
MMGRTDRPRIQTKAETLMARADYEALVVKRRARRERGVDSDKKTVVDINEGEENNHSEDKNNDPEDSETIEEALEKVLRQEAIAMFKRVLLFNEGAAKSLYEDQMITTFDILRDLDDETIKETCRAIKKPGRSAIGYQISELSVTRFKLFAFWARHMWRTCRSIDDWTNVTWDEVNVLKNQKILEDSLQDRKTPETPAMTLDTHSAAKAFLEMTVILVARCGGYLEFPLHTSCDTT